MDIISIIQQRCRKLEEKSKAVLNELQDLKEYLDEASLAPTIRETKDVDSFASKADNVLLKDPVLSREDSTRQKETTRPLYTEVYKQDVDREMQSRVSGAPTLKQPRVASLEFTSTKSRLTGLDTESVPPIKISGDNASIMSRVTLSKVSSTSAPRHRVAENAPQHDWTDAYSHASYISGFSTHSRK